MTGIRLEVCDVMDIVASGREGGGESDEAEFTKVERDGRGEAGETER